MERERGTFSAEGDGRVIKSATPTPALPLGGGGGRVLSARGGLSAFGRRVGRGGGFLGGFDAGLAFGVGGDPDLDVAGEVLGELDLDLVSVHVVEAAGEIDVVGLDVEAL